MKKDEIISYAKQFVGILKGYLTMEQADDLFIISIKGTGDTADLVSVSMYTDVKVGSLARQKLPK